MNKLTDYGVPEGKILGIKYGFRYGNAFAPACVLPHGLAAAKRHPILKDHTNL